MLNPRLLVILPDMPDADAAAEMLLDALSFARKPYGIRFALPARLRSDLTRELLSPGAFRGEELKFYAEAEGPAAWPKLVTDETHFLVLRGIYGFAEGWDRTLLSRYGKIPARRALLTGAITGEAETAQACLPAFGSATDDAASLCPGLPLVQSAAPVPTMIAYPALLFGQTTFLRDADPTGECLSILAHAAQIPLFALDRAPLWPVGQTPGLCRIVRPGPEWLPPTAVARYEQLAGISFSTGTVTARAAMGLFSVEGSYPQRLPPPLAVQDRVKVLLNQRSEMPLVVTAFIDLPDALKPPPTYMLSFEWLRAVKCLPLTLYAGGAMERHLRSVFPNTLAYPDHSLLPRALLSEGMSPMQYFQRNKLLLLRRTHRSYPTFSHVAWLDINALPHPVCPHAVPDFGALMDERIHLGWVDGEADTTLLMVPRELLPFLTRETQSITQLDTDMKRSFSERELYRRLLEHYPDRFTLHPLPRRGLLPLACLDPALLAADLRQVLATLPEPIAPPPTPAEPKERTTPYGN